METLMRRWQWATVLAVVLLSGCGYNTIQSADEQIKAAWSEVLNQYQRRADLVPNLVETVKGFAKQEKDVLTRVTEARARVGSIQATPGARQRPARLPAFQQAQGELDERAFAPARGRGELSAAQVRRQLPRPAGAARGHGEPHRGRAQPLHQGGPAVQRHRAPVPDQPHRDGVRLQAEGQLRGRERARDLQGRPRSISARSRSSAEGTE